MSMSLRMLDLPPAHTCTGALEQQKKRRKVLYGGYAAMLPQTLANKRDCSQNDEIHYACIPLFSGRSQFNTSVFASLRQSLSQ
jgi:hypothetical protein